ncbi:MAG TPA: FtsW/RodA/SpoVE family cell cycle protein [Acidimicrobiales bacterium]|nr:FtsW/RodA/SpoVE family cell cycle protein [Acidimicrobiales bacterium]
MPVLTRVRPPARDAAAHHPHARRRTELGLLVLGALIVVCAYVLAAVGTTSKIPPNLGWFLAIVLGLSLAAHIANRLYAPDANPVLLPIATLLNGLGYVMIARIDEHLARLQAAWTAVGVAAYLITLLVIRRSRDLDRYRYLLLLAAVALMLAPLVPHVGRSINGARLWVYIGPINGQPVELAKLALCIFFASYFTERRELLSVPTYRIGDRLVLDPRPLGPILVAWGFAMLVLGAERDIGFALLIFVLFIAMLWLATGRALWLVLGVVLFAVGALISSRLFSQVHVRVTAWLHPWSHASTSAYQLVHGLYGLGSGGIIGTGLGFGYLAYPFPYSDYIFASFGEEMGLLGTSLIVFAFVLMVGNGLRIAQQARSEFAKLTAAGLTLILGLQAFFIMAGIVRLLPLTGITLPFMAYGGSSLIANYILIALLMRISDEGGRPEVASQATAQQVAA